MADVVEEFMKEGWVNIIGVLWNNASAYLGNSGKSREVQAADGA